MQESIQLPLFPFESGNYYIKFKDGSVMIGYFSAVSVTTYASHPDLESVLRMR